MSIEEFQIAVTLRLNAISHLHSKPKFNIGDRVKTLPDFENSYIGKVIGVGQEGVIVSFDPVPLIEFLDKRCYYVGQDKLVKVRKSGYKRIKVY